MDLVALRTKVDVLSQLEVEVLAAASELLATGACPKADVADAMGLTVSGLSKKLKAAGLTHQSAYRPRVRPRAEKAPPGDSHFAELGRAGGLKAAANRARKRNERKASDAHISGVRERDVDLREVEF